ncbi:TlpA family protein disulfide reductase [Dokdonella sp.]|mgnify:CR=1 FL=1|uniref:TlpA family protein disulfide reductase n=1 Tax=Dokdonella sp. TaxID=2291710 RepID=UPI0031C46187|nr:TlpA family protein disulfide reductase [Dokdonella sp.]
MKPFRPFRFTLLLLAALLACPAMASEAPARPQLKVETLDGATFELAAQRGKWVIVNFWATWCSPCIKEMPDISAYVAAHANVSAIGLAYEDTDKAEIIAFAKAHPVSYPLAQVDMFEPPAGFEAPRGLPTTWLIAPDGRVASRFMGPITARDLDRAIAAGVPEK